MGRAMVLLLPCIFSCRRGLGGTTEQGIDISHVPLAAEGWSGQYGISYQVTYYEHDGCLVLSKKFKHLSLRVYLHLYCQLCERKQTSVVHNLPVKGYIMVTGWILRSPRPVGTKPSTLNGVPGQCGSGSKLGV
jgi:hypothetical protein